jgi:hypothetical protein
MFTKKVSHLAPESNAASDAVIFNNFDTNQGYSAGANATTTYNSSGQNIKLITSVAGDPGNANQCVKVVPQTGVSIDASTFANFTFWIEDTQGNNTVKVTMIDTNNAVWSGWTTAAVQNTWVGISLSMSSVTGINKGAIKEIRIGEWNKGTYYVDGLQFDTSITPPNSKSFSNQDFTAYTSPIGGLTASGVSPTPYTTAAVHPSVQSNPNSAPIFPFGAIITTNSPLYLPGYGNKSSFIVQDKGDLTFQKSQYWVDIFFDYENNPQAVPNAINFGNQKVSYTVHY